MNNNELMDLSYEDQFKVPEFNYSVEFKDGEKMEKERNIILKKN